MSSLHTVNKSPRGTRTLADCLRAALPGDCVLLIEDGVYAAVTGSDAPTDCHARQLRLCALRADIDARGLAPMLASGVEVVDDSGFVDLCCQFQKTCSWY